MKRIEFSKEQIADICKKYLEERISMKKISEDYGVSRGTITRVLKENGVEIRKDNHVYKADYRKFENIDTPEKAYWLGFIAADGCVFTRKENATIKIAIHQKDREHLEKFQKFMNSNVKITEYLNDTGYSEKSPTPMCSISFNSVDMAQDFIKHGIVPKKSLILEPPKIDKEFYLPYILGYFDGDGTIFKYNNDTEFTIGFVGSLETIKWINEVLGLNAILEQRRAGSQTYYIRCGGTNKPYKYLKMLYDSTEVHLTRKFILFQELENVVLNRNIK